MSHKTPITVAHGDGIGPEIMDAALRILEAGGASLDIEVIQVGEAMYKQGYTSGIPPQAWDSMRRTRVLYKAPITTPQGSGYKSLNVTIRKTLGLYANVRPVESFHPYISTKHPHINVVIIRENEEDLYAGIEHRQTVEVAQTLKLLSRPGSEKIIRYAFNYARRNNRKKITAFTKDNIMKLTDGLFHSIFREIAQEYPDIQAEHMIIDIGTAKLAATPEDFDIVVVPNLYGDIVSDVAVQLAGSVGLGESANIGENCAMFEAIHGSAPDIADKGIANPSGLLLAGVMMLVHLGQVEAAARIRNAWLRTIEQGIHTGDIYQEGSSTQRVDTADFTKAVIENLGHKPRQFPVVEYAAKGPMHPPTDMPASHEIQKVLVGVDVFLDWEEANRNPDVLGNLLQEKANGDGLALVMITNRGLTVFPQGHPETFCTDHWRCRFMSDSGTYPVTHAQIISLLQRIADLGLDFIKIENLYEFDGEPGFSMGQGQNTANAQPS